jgi:C4-dicarboxylate-binding protein DctP
MNTREMKAIGLMILAILITFVAFNGNAYAKVTLRMLGFLPMTHQLTKTAETFIKEAEKDSKGEIEVQHFPAAQLYNHQNSIPVLTSGGVDMAIVESGMWTGVVPSAELLGFCSYFKNKEHFKAVMDGYPGEVIKNDFQERGNLKVLSWFNYGKTEIASKDPITKLEDFKSKRIRSGGSVEAIFLQALGAAPVNIAAGEVYQALQKGTVDGAVSGPSSFETRKWYEVVKNATSSNIRLANAYFLAISMNTWNKLSPQLQTVILDAGKKAQVFNFEIADREDIMAIEKLQKAGMVFNKISDKEQERWRDVSMGKFIELFKKHVGEQKVQKMFDAVEDLRKKY